MLSAARSAARGGERTLLHKPEIVALLRPGRDNWSGEDWLVFSVERAGIVEFDGGCRGPLQKSCLRMLRGRWLNRNPARSEPDSCHHCGGSAGATDKPLPYGTRNNKPCLAAFGLLGGVACKSEGYGRCHLVDVLEDRLMGKRSNFEHRPPTSARYLEALTCR